MTTLRFKRFKIEPYKPGKSSIKKLKKIIKLSANESALGVSPKAKKNNITKKPRSFQISRWKIKKINKSNIKKISMP